MTGVGGMGRDRNGGKLGGFVLFPCVLADRLFFLAYWKWKMHARMALVGPVWSHKLAIYIVIGRGLQLVAPRRDVLDLQVLEHQRLIAVIGNQQADREKAVLLVILLE